jgi:hypothetical protein
VLAGAAGLVRTFLAVRGVMSIFIFFAFSLLLLARVTAAAFFFEISAIKRLATHISCSINASLPASTCHFVFTARMEKQFFK